MVHQVLQRFGCWYSLPQSTPLPTSHSLSALPSDESVELSGLYPELVGCLMYLMTSTLPDLAYPLSILARYVAPGRHQRKHSEAAKRVLRYLYSTCKRTSYLSHTLPAIAFLIAAGSRSHLFGRAILHATFPCPPPPPPPPLPPPPPPPPPTPVHMQVHI
ncbi:unnamed protein product [Closterium sp. NIES-54]